MSFQELKTKLKKIDITPNINQLEKLIYYLKLMQKWNKVYNLTSINNYQQMLDLHIVDSASVVDFILGDRVLDVGTGAGLPGIVLAILLPDYKFTLLDSNNKKTRFLKQCQISLELNNIELVNDRIENFQPKHKFNSIISRAFSSLEDFISKSKNLLADNGKILAMKGSKKETATFNFNTYDISIDNINRHLVEINQREL